MEYLNTFFGQILRRNDVDFMQQSMRDGVVETHHDLTNALGGVIQGLDVSVSSDGLSVYVSPGIFYNGGPINSNNGFGGGERGELFEQQTFTNLTNTPLVGTQQSYLVVYAKTINQNYNADTAVSQDVITSAVLQSGKKNPVRNYTNAIIAISSPVLAAQFNLMNGIPLALLQVDQSAATIITNINGVSYKKRSYIIGNVVDVENKIITDSALNYVLSKVKATELINISSTGISAWDGTTAYNSLSGSGIANQHLKDIAVTADKINPANGLSSFSIDNYIFNGSFDIINNNGDVSDIVGWNTWVEADGVADVLAPYNASIVKNINESFDTFNSLQFNGPDSIIIAPVLGTPYGLAAWQDISFAGLGLSAINDRSVMASFYMKIGAMDTTIAGVSGIQAYLQFLSNGAELGAPIQFANYTGSALGWTKFITTEPVKYTTTNPLLVADGVRLKLSGSITNATLAYFDEVYLGLTDIAPAWTRSQSEKDYSDTLVKTNIIADDVTVNLNLTSPVINSVSSGITTLGSSSKPFKSLYSDNVECFNSIAFNGAPLPAASNKFEIITGNYIWTVPSGIYSATLIAVGGGGAGKATLLGGGGGEWVKTWINTNPGDQFQIYVGASGVSGGNGGDTTIGPVGLPILPTPTAQGGFGGNAGASGGGSNSLSSNSIKLKGQSGTPTAGGSTNVGASVLFGIGGTSTTAGSFFGAGGYVSLGGTKGAMAIFY